MLVLLGIAIVAYIAPLLAGATFVGRDHLTHTLPSKQFLSDTLRDGRVPEWWPAVDLGVSFAANPNHSALYPVAWLVAVLPMPWGADVLLMLHVVFGGLGVAALARRLGAEPSGSVVGGAAFMLAGFVSSTVVHGGPALTLAWAPWIAWAADRVATNPKDRRLESVLVLGAFVAGGLFAGDPSFAIIGGVLAIGIASVRGPQRLQAVALVVTAQIVAVVLAAIVIVPALYLLRDSSRAGGVGDDVALAWSMHPLRLLELVWPNAFGDPNHETAHLARAIADTSAPLKLSPSWALGLYLSIPVLGAAVIGAMQAERRTRALLWLLPVFLVLALGRYTPIYELYRTLFVPERLVRYPEKYLGGAIVLVCMFAALGWSALVPRARMLPRRTLMIASIVVGVLAIVVASASFVIPGYARAADVSGLQPALDVEAGITNARAHVMPALATLVGVIAALYVARRGGRLWLVHLAAVLLVGHLVGRTWALLPTFDREILAHRPAVLGHVPPGRLARPREHRMRPGDPLTAQAQTLYEGAAPNVATRYGFSYLLGYDQGHSGRFEAAQQALAVDDSMNDRYGADFEIVERDATAGRPILGSDEPYGPYALVRNDGARPRAFVTERWTWHTEPGLPNTALDAVTLYGHGPSHDGAGGLTPCTVMSHRPEHVDLICNASSGDSYAVLLDAWAPGWTVTIDGAPARIELAEGLVRAVAVGPGRHVIAYRYTTPGLRLGAAISLVAWMLWIATLAVRGLRRRASVVAS